MIASTWRWTKVLQAAALALVVAGCPARAPQSGGAAGWEGFYPPKRIDAAWLAQREIPLAAEVVARVWPRVAKLALAQGVRQSSEAEVQRAYRRYCGPDAVRAWNDRRCAALDARSCRDGRCTYQHFGNCSGFVLRRGMVLTAAHCVAELAGNSALAGASTILLPAADGRPGRRAALRSIILGKRDFAHDWVSLEEQRPLDVALVRFDDPRARPAWPLGAVPERGEVVFIVGYPRAEARPEGARRAAGYRLTFGTPSASFGRVVDANREGRPFCSVDGLQEHWALRAPCPVKTLRLSDGSRGFAGPIYATAFLSSSDSINGYSGSPVFDDRGQLVGVNATVAGGVDPREQYTGESRAVAIPIEPALERLGLPADAR